MKYDKSVKDYVLSGIDINDLVSRRVELKRVGSNMRGLCPFHSEKTPSFYVSESRNSYYCFGCKNHGNAIDFVMQTENLEFLEALESLADRYNIDLRPYIIEEDTKKDYSLINKIFEMNRVAGKFFHNELIKNKLALEYFEDRQITINTIKTFGLGYSPDSWNALLNHLKSSGYTEKDILITGLASKSEKGNVFDRFRNRIIYPIFDYRSRVLGFGARSMTNEMPKYLNSPESLVFQKSKILYGDRMARKNVNSDTLILVEGYMDLLQVYQSGFHNVMASMGTALTSEQVFHISKRYKIVLFAYDMDEAGRNAISKSIPLLENYGIEVKVVNISPSKDPDEFIKKFGSLAFQKRLENAENTIKFNLINIKEKYNLRDAKERYNFVMESMNLISKCGVLESEVYLQELAEVSTIPFDKLLAEFVSYDKTLTKDNYLSSSLKFNNDGGIEQGEYAKKDVLNISLYEKQLIALAINNKEYALKIFDETLGEFITEDYLSIFSILMMYYSNNDSFDPINFSEDLDLDSAVLLQQISDTSESNFTEEELYQVLNRWTSEKTKLEIEKIDLEIKTLNFLDDEESKIETRILRKKRSSLIKKIYDSKNKKSLGGD